MIYVYFIVYCRAPTLISGRDSRDKNTANKKVPVPGQQTNQSYPTESRNNEPNQPVTSLHKENQTTLKERGRVFCYTSKVVPAQQSVGKPYSKQSIVLCTHLTVCTGFRLALSKHETKLYK